MEFYDAINKLSFETHCVIVWPNIDGGSDKISKIIRGFREQNKLQNCSFYKNFAAEDYPTVIKNAKLCIGNSSSFVREGAHLGVGAVITGNRQRDRDVYGNATFVAMKTSEILSEVKAQTEKSFIPAGAFGDGNAGKKIANKLIEIFEKS